MKKNKMMRMASALLVATLLSTSVIAGTFAKYTSNATGTDTATVAEWKVSVNDADITDSDTFTYNFEDNWACTGNGTVDSNLLAPGTSGHFTVTVKNESDVQLDYTTVATITNEGAGTGKKVPMQFSVVKWEGNTVPEAGTYTTASYSDDSANVTELQKITGSNVTSNTGVEKYEVYWKWAYDNSNDSNDTEIGKLNTQATYKLNLKITATQSGETK